MNSSTCAFSENLGAPHSRNSSRSNFSAPNRAVTPPKKPAMLSRNSNGMSPHHLLQNSQNKHKLNMPPLQGAASLSNSPYERDCSTSPYKDRKDATQSPDSQLVFQQNRESPHSFEEKLPVFASPLGSHQTTQSDIKNKNQTACLSLRDNRDEVELRSYQRNLSKENDLILKYQGEQIQQKSEREVYDRPVFSINLEDTKTKKDLNPAKQISQVAKIDPIINNRNDIYRDHSSRSNTLERIQSKNEKLSSNQDDPVGKIDTNSVSVEAVQSVNKEILTWRSRVEAGQFSKLFKQMEEEIQKLDGEIQDRIKSEKEMKERNEQLREECKRKVNELGQNVKNKENQIQQLTEQNLKDQLKIDSLLKKIEHLQQTVSIVHEEATKQENSNNAIRERFEKLVKINEALIEKNNSYQNKSNELETLSKSLKSKNTQLLDQIEELNLSSNLKSKQLDEIKSEYLLVNKEIESAKKYEINFTTEINLIREEISQKKLENKRLEQLNEESISKNKKLVSQLTQLQGENDEARSSFAKKNEEIQTIWIKENEKLLKLNKELSYEIEEITSKFLKENEDIKRSVFKENEDLRDIKRSLLKENEDLRIKLEKMKENEDIKRSLFKEKEDLRIRLMEKEEQIRMLADQNQNLRRELDGFNEDKEALKKESNRLNWIISEQAQNIISFKKKSEQYLSKYQKYKNKYLIEDSKIKSQPKDTESIQALESTLENQKYALKEKTQEILFWKNKSDNYQIEFEELEKRLQASLRSNQTLNEKISKFSEISSMRDTKIKNQQLHQTNSASQQSYHQSYNEKENFSGEYVQNYSNKAIDNPNDCKISNQNLQPFSSNLEDVNSSSKILRDASSINNLKQ